MKISANPRDHGGRSRVNDLRTGRFVWGQMPITKTCTQCRHRKSVRWFRRDRRNPGHINSNCLQCEREKARLRYHNSPDAINATTWRGKLKVYYGISYGTYQRLLQEQDGVCAICKRPERDRRLSVDHDHSTKKVRGLLCRRCNAGLGHFDDSPKRIVRALIYLKKEQEAA